jgi:transcriptional regulator with AAA-type ATPase domain/tetratricopeptide (TPR) repeat protein
MGPLGALLGDSPGMTALRERALRLIQRPSDQGRLPPLLIQGETGVGKGLLARILHEEGPRAEHPFKDVNCAAIPDTLIEAELFGFERGAFTDARQPKEGLFQAANHGTLFLDEVALLPESLQAKLLKALEDRAVRRLGATRAEPVDVWIVTASNADLVAAVRARRFREDLYHRLAVVTLRLPPLRERDADIVRLAEHFLARACQEYGRPAKRLAADAVRALLQHSWPGNVRELMNAMERVTLMVDAPVVSAAALDLSAPSGPAPQAPEPAEPDQALGTALGAVERARLLEALDETFWNVTRAARRLGVSRDTLRYRIAKHRLRPGGARPAVAPEPASEPAAPVPPSRPAIPPEAAASAVRWEQRRVTVLRAVIDGPPPEDDRLYPSRLIETLIDKARSFGGRVEDLGPTGIVAAFGLEPVEDAAHRAAHAAVAIRKAVEHGRRAGSPRATVRLGIHVSQLLVGYAGRDIRLELDGKRRVWQTLESLVRRADPDETIVSEPAAPFLDRRFVLVALPPGVAEEDLAYRLEGVDRAGLGSSRRLTVLAGRRHELELLRDRFAAAADGHGQVVGIVGEAGIGKSRLLLELRRSLRSERAAWFDGRCLSYGSAVPYLPVTAILRRSVRIAEGDSAASIVRKVRAGLDELGMDPEEWAPYLHHLLGVKEGTERLGVLSREAFRARTVDALRQMCLRGSRQRPIVFVCEDLQWVDSSSEECLASLIEASAGAAVLSLLTYRPGYRPPWMDKSYATQLSLQPLSRGDSQRIVESLLGPRDARDALAPAILSKAEGNPFFLEELCRAVGEQPEAAAVAVPDTVEEALRARIDRLPEDVKTTLRLASVIGREIPLETFQAVWRGPGDFEAHLRELTRLEFLYEQSRPPESVYVFKHALTQEVVYDSLPVAQRHALHTAVAAALERLYEGRLDEADARLAYHYARTDQADRAVECLSRVAEKAARGSAHVEALGVLEEALAHVERLPAEVRDRRRLRLVLRKVSALIHLGRFGEVLGALLQWKGSLERLDDPSLAASYHFLLARTNLFLGERERAIQGAERAITEAARSGDTATRGKAHYVLAQEAPLSGRAAEGIGHALEALACLECAGDEWWIGQAHWVVGLNHAQLGELAAALEAETRARTMAETGGNRQLQASALWATGIVQAGLGQTEAGIEACQLSLAVAPDPLTRAVALGWLGFAFVEHGDAPRAIPVLEAAALQHGAFPFPQFQGWFTAFLAEAYRLDGQVERAHATAREALEITRVSRSQYGVGLALRALGRIQLAAKTPTEAMATLEEALATFEAMQGRYDAARVWLDLGEAALATGNRAAARQHRERARQRFVDLRVPRWAERAEALARSLDASA